MEERTANKEGARGRWDALYSRAFVASRGQVRVRMCVLKVVVQ